jgi:hypothetical protein
LMTVAVAKMTAVGAEISKHQWKTGMLHFLLAALDWRLCPQNGRIREREGEGQSVSWPVNVSPISWTLSAERRNAQHINECARAKSVVQNMCRRFRYLTSCFFSWPHVLIFFFHCPGVIWRAVKLAKK